jgi:uncharacterized RDD family membrane protein YckC
MAAVPRPYAGLVSRAIAYLLDALIVALVFTAGAVVMGLIAPVIGTRVYDVARDVGSAYLLVLPALLAVYCALFWSLAGRTPGMALVGVRVVTVGGRPVSWPAALVRAVVLAYFPVGAVWALVDRRHQAVHDKIARTVVIRPTIPARASPAAADAAQLSRLPSRG